MNMDLSFLNQVVFGNTLNAYLICIGVILGGISGLWVLKVIVIRQLMKWAAKTENHWDDFIIDSIGKYLVPLLYFTIIQLSFAGLRLHPIIPKVLSLLTAVVVTLVGILFVKALVQFIVFDFYLSKHPYGPDLKNRFNAVMPALTIIIWLTGTIFLLDNLGFKISAIITGLGIGGVAVALAASTILSELFSYFSIMLDRPFVIGDFIVIGDLMGTVEKIGIKTTRVRSLGGELLVISNKDLTDSHIRNFQKMEKRRVLFRLGVTYDTPIARLKEIPGIIKSIITKISDVQFDRAHFANFGDFSLNFEVVYFVLHADYNKYMDVQETINLNIADEFAKRKIEFAFPTQTLHVGSVPNIGVATMTGATASRASQKES